MKQQLRTYRRSLSPDCPESKDRESQNQDQGLVYAEEEEAQGRRCRKAFFKITLHFLRNMELQDLCNTLKNRMEAAVCQRKLKTTLKTRLEEELKEVMETFRNPVYTELAIIKEGREEVNPEYLFGTTSWKRNPTETIRQNNIFTSWSGGTGPTRTVMTKGVAGIGKTVLTQNFTLDWAEDRAHQDVHFIFPFSFRELNVVKEKKFSLMELIHHFFTETKDTGICSFDQFKVIFIFDGLDECRLPLDLHGTEVLTDVTESTSVQVLLTNLIRGNLLPSARLWITSRPAAADQIPLDLVDVVTEVRGFTDVQKEEYFRRRFRDEEQANKIISHIQASRSLHIMCHIPVFCWITATVLEDVVRTRGGGAEELPKTLTEMYVHFLVVQFTEPSTCGRSEQEKRKMIQFLGKLAFEQLQKGNLIFYKEDLRQCGLDTRSASVYAKVFPQIFQEGKCWYQDTVFFFVHLSIQEFLAALYVHLTFITSGVNPMSKQPLVTTPRLYRVFKDKPKLIVLHQSAVEQALRSSSGQLDLFLRFLLGLSEDTNQTLMTKLLKPTGSDVDGGQQTVEFICEKMKEDLSPEKSINLFYCLNELKDQSLTQEIQQSLRSGHLSPAQWSALVFILLSSAEDLKVFDLKKFSASEEALLRLLPVVKASARAVLSNCGLSEQSCEALASVLRSPTCSLRHLDLSNNHLQDSGVRLLCEGLGSPHCVLESLSLSGCLLTDDACVHLASALSLNPSHLRELDLSNNNLQESGAKLLSAGLEHSSWRLDKVRVSSDESQRSTSDLRQFSCEIYLDPITAHKNLRLSNANRKVDQVTRPCSYPEDRDRFDIFCQVLCGKGLSGRCYWEVDWEGQVDVAVSLRGIGKKGYRKTCRFGGNDMSWCLSCSADGYSVWHNDKETPLHTSFVSHRVGVYVDCLAGILSFYRVPDRSPLLLHSFTFKFSDLLYPGFRVWFGSVSLCPKDMMA
uniref:B30.2/SPRY domain-containing protein n=3 Tax=Cynoglossus semilaevis TaxID=244447 RepID=A0A3P8V4N1_CYNSE